MIRPPRTLQADTGRPISAAPKDAADWVARLHSDQVVHDDEAAFQAWLGARPENALEYAAHEKIWQEIGGLASNAEARAILMRPASGRQGIGRRALISGGITALAASIAAIALPSLGKGKAYHTGPGERREFVLSDGSIVTLNVDSRLSVDIGKQERRLFLEHGQVFFDVAKDVARPFRVFAGENEVRALGTAFDVHRNQATVQVTLEEGEVAVYGRERGEYSYADVGIAEPGADMQSIKPLLTLRKGQRVQLSPSTPATVVDVDIRITEAWRYGRIIFEGTPLGDAVEELNRYRGRKIILANNSLRNLKVSGVFHTNRSEVFIDSLTAAFPVRVVPQNNAMITLLDFAEHRQ